MIPMHIGARADRFFSLCSFITEVEECRSRNTLESLFMEGVTIDLHNTVSGENGSSWPVLIWNDPVHGSFTCDTNNEVSYFDENLNRYLDNVRQIVLSHPRPSPQTQSSSISNPSDKRKEYRDMYEELSTSQLKGKAYDMGCLIMFLRLTTTREEMIDFLTEQSISLHSKGYIK